MKAAIINGPNLNLLGTREPEIYGTTSLDTVIDKIKEKGESYGWQILSFQSNSEGEIVDFIHKQGFQCDYLIINAAAYTHTSIAIRDAVAGVSADAIEVHISNIYKREAFRHKSHLTDVCIGVISGFGIYGYEMALDYIKNKTQQQHNR